MVSRRGVVGTSQLPSKGKLIFSFSFFIYIDWNQKLDLDLQWVNCTALHQWQHRVIS